MVFRPTGSPLPYCPVAGPCPPIDFIHILQSRDGLPAVLALLGLRALEDATS